MHGGHAHAYPGRGLAPGSGGIGNAFILAMTLNAAFVAIEAGFGLTAHSLALVADAGHNLGDVCGLLLAWGAVRWARRRPTLRHTYGWGRFSILAALGNALLLLVAVALIAGEAVRRLVEPAPVAARTVIWVAALGIVLNGATAALFASERKRDLNVRSIFRHMAADAAFSAGVVAAGIGMLVTGWLWLDPLVSLGLAAIIVAGTWKLLREAVDLAIDGVPMDIDARAVRRFLAAQAGVRDVHHLHIWGLSTTETALTAHLVLAGERTDDELLGRIGAGLRQHFGIGHATLQVESRRLPQCEAGECHPEKRES
ncbi:MAG: cation diffusion facilitator family transporter [Opitutaceae bacterium]